MPFVPVVDFWSAQSSISTDELRAAAAGTSAAHPRVVTTSEDVDVVRGLLGGDAVEGADVAGVEAAVRQGALGILRATDVTQRVHALAVDGVSLYGNDRIESVADWPLVASVLSTVAWDQSSLWTLVAAGDVMMDRGVAKAVREHGDDGGYLFDGGTARITRLKCCSFFGFEVPVTEKTGNAGAVRDLFSSADMAMANLESAVLINAPWHSAGFTFTADASLLDDVDEAGFDYMSAANNHIRNAGNRGILTAAEQLDLRGIAHSGSGRGADASVPGYVEIESAGVTVAMLSCDAIVPSWTVTEDKVGTVNCKRSDVASIIRSIRDTADVVIVYPHWGHEYKPKPASYQLRLSQEWIDAGADMVVGAHSHIAGAMGDVDGHVIFFSLGNLIFDQDFRQSTMMGVIPEMTWSGNRVVQIKLHASLIIDSQPNLISAADGGDFVFDQMRDASVELLPY
jgi:poly-gamma-glutamate capsule biosynthesis protein CapA/YwtB (metallophosphatase superfamily)